MYAYLRLEQRLWTSGPSLAVRFRTGARAIGYTVFNLILSFGLSAFHLIPAWVWLPFLLQAAETLWGTINPAVGAKPVAVGMRQLAVTTLFTILFIITWR